MKKLLVALFFGLVGLAEAAPPSQGYSVTRTSFSASAQNPTLFSSHTIQFIGVNVTSSSGAGYMVIYRSTSPTFTFNISSQTVIPTGFSINAVGVQTIPLYDMTNTSYTYIQKLGADSETTIFFRCVGQSNIGNCPGLRWNAQK